MCGKTCSLLTAIRCCCWHDRTVSLVQFITITVMVLWHYINIPRSLERIDDENFGIYIGCNENHSNYCSTVHCNSADFNYEACLIFWKAGHQSVTDLPELLNSAGSITFTTIREMFYWYVVKPFTLLHVLFWFQAEAALIYDSVFVFAIGLQTLEQSHTLKLSNVSCDREQPWDGGLSLINYINAVRYQKNLNLYVRISVCIFCKYGKNRKKKLFVA